MTFYLFGVEITVLHPILIPMSDVKWLPRGKKFFVERMSLAMLNHSFKAQQIGFFVDQNEYKIYLLSLLRRNYSKIIRL